MNPQNLQTHFYQYLIAPNNTDCAQKEILKHIQHPKSTTTAEQRLKIYYDAYRLRLLECLETDFPNLSVLMGSINFNDMGQAYIQQHPSQHFSIRYFGQYLSAFLKTTQPYAQHGFLAEMAAFEWAQGETLDAEDGESLTPEVLKTYSPEQFPTLCLQFHPSMRILECQWDTPVLALLIEQNQAPREPVQQPSPIHWVLWRKELVCVYRSCTQEEAYALMSMQKGDSFGKLCEGLCQYQNETEVPQMAIQFVLNWLSEGLISGILVSN